MSDWKWHVRTNHICRWHMVTHHHRSSSSNYTSSSSLRRWHRALSSSQQTWPTLLLCLRRNPSMELLLRPPSPLHLNNRLPIYHYGRSSSRAHNFRSQIFGKTSRNRNRSQHSVSSKIPTHSPHHAAHTLSGTLGSTRFWHFRRMSINLAEDAILLSKSKNWFMKSIAFLSLSDASDLNCISVRWCLHRFRTRR